MTLAALARLATGLPAGTLRDAASDRAGALAALLPELGAALGVAPVALGCADAQEHRCDEAVAVFLRRLSVHRPVLFVLDDLQDADPATVRLLHRLACDQAHPAGVRLLLLATVRTEWEASVAASLRPAAGRLELGPLAPTAIAQLAAAAGLADQADLVSRRAGGHPLLVAETLRGLAEGATGIPEPVRTAILERVRRAGAPAAELLYAAAVLGRRFTPGGLASLLGIGEPEAARRCERVLPSRLIVLAGDGYRFANELVREVLYQAAPAPTRVAYRRAVSGSGGERLRHRVQSAGHRRAAWDA